MMIFTNHKKEFIEILDSIIVACIKTRKDLTERVLFDLIKMYPEVKIEPDIYKLDEPRNGYGWTYSTLKYYASMDLTTGTISMPAAEMISTPNVTPDPCKKLDDKDICINCSREDLLREIKKLDIQIQKIKQLIEGEDN